MASALLETKLYIPRARRRLVSRTRLTRILDRTIDARLTLISAPAGFGKTTLLAEWIAALPSERAAIAWVSLDAQDSEPAAFWSYVIEALRRASPVISTLAESVLSSKRPSAVQEMLTGLINQLDSSGQDIVLVLDDYHVIEQREVHEAVAFLIEHLPQSLHLVIASRVDPPLPLALLRARGELVELRAADLRFRHDETAAYLNDVMALELASPQLDTLEGRTEGWIAALQLAAVSMQGRDDATAFIESFAGDNRYIVDYLVQEVLQRQGESTREFLLRTAILDRMNAGLCDAVMGLSDGQDTLRRLEQDNVLVVPLDDRREWYRYHHLFADVLRAHLMSERPEEVSVLHRRASSWFEANGDRHEAIRHALAGREFDYAAGLIELAFPAMLRARQDATLRVSVDSLPPEVVRLRPVINTGYVSVLLHHGELSTVEARLRDAEEALPVVVQVKPGQQHPDDLPVYVDEAQFHELPGMIALYRAGYAQVIGRLDDTVAYARLALERLPAEHPLRGGAMALLGLALWSNGELEAAYESYAAGIALTHGGGYTNDSSTIMLADMRVSQGRLREAVRMYEGALARVDAQGTAAPSGTADLHVGLSEIYLEQGDLERAQQHLSRSSELGESAGLPENRYRWFVAMAGLRQAQGEHEEALDFLDRADRLFMPGFSPDVRPIAALRTRVWLMQGRLADAVAWTRSQGLSPEDEPTYLREFQLLTLARVLIAQSERDAAPALCETTGRLLARLIDAAEAGGRSGAHIEGLVLQSLVQRATGDAAAALASLRRALSLAQPEGYVRVFLDAGAPLVTLLERLAAQEPASYARRLLSGPRSNPIVTTASQPSGDALSEREVDVLRLLASDLSGPDIARELVVSLNTLRTHTKSIYTKLGVNSRREAVRRAHDLGLL